ncbi:MAG TPA: DUF6468 domain-containing protein [Parvularculaceae bacterium]|nr:DUF6468 domain-containing protein [Parvularculaceae bacterium]HNS87409.1 DUF6468 domain-containing protein [Parvularculaceae bacterium]
MTVGLVLDIALIALLLSGAAGGVFISRKLQRLTAAQEELKAALTQFDEAAARADAAMKRLETGGLARGAQLEAATKRAETLLTELSVMSGAGARIADRIEGAVAEVRRLGASGASRNPRRAA